MESKYIKQHIVPKSYLQRFADKGDSAYRIGVWQKNNKHYIASIDNVGYLKNYYDVEHLEDKKKWEHFFSENIEAPCDKPISHIISRTMLSSITATILYDYDKLIMSRYIITQLYRVPAFIDYHIGNSKKKVDTYKADILKRVCFLPTEYQETIRNINFTDDQYKDNILLHLESNLDRYCKVLTQKVWVVYVNQTSLPFITSDDSVVMTNIQSKSTSRNDNGIGNESTLIFFPLNSHIAIGIYPKSFSWINGLDGKIAILKSNDTKWVCHMNLDIMNQCYNQTFLPIDLYNNIFTK